MTTDDTAMSRVLPSLPASTGVNQPPYLGGVHSTLVLSVEFFSHLLHSFRAFTHVPDEGNCMNL